MKNKKLICIIAIICVVTCALSVILTACGTNTNRNGSNDDSNVDIQEPFDFNAITENDWKGEQLTEKQWKKAFEASNFDNVSIYVGGSEKEKTDLPDSFYSELNAKRAEENIDLHFYTHKTKYFTENDKVYGCFTILDETNTTDRNNMKFLWVKDELDGKIEDYTYSYYLGSFSLPKFKEKYSDFEYKDGAYFSKNMVYFVEEYNSVKITFKDGKLYMVSFDEKLIYAYRNYGNTKVSIPKDFISPDDIHSHDYEYCIHVDNNNNDFCDLCHIPVCKEHIDQNNDDECDWCYDYIEIEHVDENNNGFCDTCSECMKHVDEDNNGQCDKCYKYMRHVDEDNDGKCDIRG